MRSPIRNLSSGKRLAAVLTAGVLAVGAPIGLTQGAGGINVFTGSSTIPTGDTTPPDTTITSAPTDGTSTSASIPFTGSDNVGVTGFDCRIDGGSYTSCTSPKSYSGLSVATHTFDVRAKDAAGNVDPTPASATWTISSGGGSVPVNQVAPYFCGQALATENLDMVGGCSGATQTAVQGNTMRVGTGVWSNGPTNFSYQWQQCTTTGGQPPTTASCSDISGATSSTYTVQAGDVGKSLVPKVTANNGSGSSTPTSAAGSCNKGSTTYARSPDSAPVTIHPDPRIAAGCSPISAVVGTTSTTMKFCTNSPVTCGFPDPLSGNVGVLHGTTLTTVANLTCSSGTTSNVYVTGNMNISGTCTLTNSRVNAFTTNLCTNCTFSRLEASGGYASRSAATTGTGEVPNISSDCSYTVNGTDGQDVAIANTTGSNNTTSLTTSYLHCAGESLNGSIGATSSYIISDACWGPCYGPATVHNEAIYEYGGQSGLRIIGNVILNPWDQTAGLFTDCGWNGSPRDEWVNGNLVATYNNNGALGVDNGTFGCTGTRVDNQVKDNRFSYIYNSAMNCGYFNGPNMTVSGNMRDDNNAAITSC